MAVESSSPDVHQLSYEFVKKYFNVLLNSPHKAHKFYRDGSKFDHHATDSSTTTTTTVNGIINKILSLKYGQFTADIKSLIAQESANSGIIVLVTGLLIGKFNLIRSFTQALHLAPGKTSHKKKKGFYVLNDILQYVDNPNSHYKAELERVVEPTNKIEDKIKNKSSASTSPLPEIQAELERVVEPTNGIVKKKKKKKAFVITEHLMITMQSRRSKSRRRRKKSSEEQSRRSKSRRRREKSSEEQKTDKPLACTSFLGGSDVSDTDWITPDPCGGKSLKKDCPTNEQHLAIGREWRVNASQERNSSNFYKGKARTEGTSKDRVDAYQKFLSHEQAARQADCSASKILFTARSSVFNNRITIDLHDQHVKEAIWILKRHLKYCTLMRSIRFLIVITGYGRKTDGVSKIKPSIIHLLDEEKVKWEQEENNPGKLVITIDKDKEFSFFKTNWASS